MANENTNAFSTAGFKLKYAVEVTAGTRPTTGYTELGNIVSIGKVDNEPGTLDITDLSETEYKQSIPGLKEAGNVAIKMNFTQAAVEKWGSLVSSSTNASGGRKMAWFEVVPPAASGYSKSFFFGGYPSKLGFPGADVDSVFQGDGNITIAKVEGWAEASTEA